MVRYLQKTGALLHAFMAVVWVAFAVSFVSPSAAQDVEYLGDRNAGISMQHQQQWGDFGFDVATAATGGVGAPMRIGQTVYQRGLGHHANGEIVIDLRGQYLRFRSWVGVHWQGGNRGSVIFKVSVDGEVKFQTEPMSDSEPAVKVELPLEGAQQLRLIATDAGDGIGCDMANWAEACLERNPHVPSYGETTFEFSNVPLPTASSSANGLSFVAGPTGPQAVVMESAKMLMVSVADGEHVRWMIPVRHVNEPVRILVDVSVIDVGQADVELLLGAARVTGTVHRGDVLTLATPPTQLDELAQIIGSTRGAGEDTGVCWSNLRYAVRDGEFPIPMRLPATAQQIPPSVLPAMRSSVEQMMIEWDWRMQDGIATQREPRTWQQATESVFERGDQLLEYLTSMGVALKQLADQWETTRDEYHRKAAVGTQNDPEWERIWRQTHRLRRQIALANPLSQVGPLVFVKRVPSGFSHQLTQYGGHRARPGGGVFVLEAPGQSMRCRQLGELPVGSYMHLDVSWDGQHVLVAQCETDPAATQWTHNPEQFYHLYEISADGSDVRQLTDGSYDDFAPRYLPNGKIIFVSTRRGGFHRCGRGPCAVYTLAVADRDGSNVRVVSFHETHEWDPAVLNDGRVIYTRWDYVDRHAVHYQQLWSVRQDGSDVRAFYGNNTLNPVGVWEARAVPGSQRVMATAAAHHAMTAGSIILLDVTKGMDGLEPITRLTPDALFPESEFPVQHWHAPAGVPEQPAVPIEEKRWPGHCYRSPYPLSEDFFLAAYSFDPLIGEPHANRPNMFGLYLVDRFGNKELLYRDANIGSLWPMPLRARLVPPSLPSVLVENQPEEGTFWMQDVYASWPGLNDLKGGDSNGPDSNSVVKSLRVLQVLPKTTPHANTPRVGLANASPGKQVLGTVPVEPDGSAYFRAPAGIPLAFQALDDRGMAIQTMRSLTYLQPGERVGCIGCHEHRTTSSAVGNAILATQREPSRITPGPDGSMPFSYAILVQPILDKHCVECHGGDKSDAGIDLTGAPDGQFSRSYNALIPLVSFSEWKGTPQANHEPLTHPGQFGARASRLMRLLLEGHEGITLSDQELERLITWMDANALFYGTFSPEDQLRQLHGERIAGPALE